MTDILAHNPHRSSPHFALPGCRIADLQDLLQKRDRILGVVETEAEELAAKFGNPRRTAILTDGGWPRGGRAAYRG